MIKAFLYIDILGFREMIESKSDKIENIFSIIDRLKAHRHYALQVVMFSDTVLIFNKEDSHPDHYFYTFLVEYTQILFYNLSLINVYFKAILTAGEFGYKRLNHIERYYGQALLDCYDNDKTIKAIGLFIDKRISSKLITFDVAPFSDKFDYVLLCQSLINLYKHTTGILPVEFNLLTDTDTYYRIDEDLNFFRDIRYLKENHPVEQIRWKYQQTYDIYSSYAPTFFKLFEREGFIPLLVNEQYTGAYNFNIINAEEDLKRHKIKPEK